MCNAADFSEPKMSYDVKFLFHFNKKYSFFWS